MKNAYKYNTQTREFYELLHQANAGISETLTKTKTHTMFARTNEITN